MNVDVDPFAAIRIYEQEVIIVPTLLLASFLVTLVFILLLRFCPERVERIRPKSSNWANGRVLHGIDGKTLERGCLKFDMMHFCWSLG